MSEKPRQIEYAEDFLCELELFLGIDYEELDVGLILDSLACAGLKLSKDNKGIAAEAFGMLCIRWNSQLEASQSWRAAKNLIQKNTQTGGKNNARI